jgi:predicted TPR repeat methyltransferase
LTDPKRYLDDIYKLTTETPGDAVQDTYDKWAETYDTELIDENGYAMPDRVAEMMTREAGHLKREAILDVGCGTGLSGVALKANGFQIIDGCDFSEGMRAVAAKRGVYRELFHADLNTPPTKVVDGAYAAATAVGVFAHGHLKGIALDEIVRCVRPGGPICVTTNDKYWAEGVLRDAMDRLEAAGVIRVRVRDHGTHIAGRGVDGWVFLLEKQ